MPEGYEHLWQWFGELQESRQSDMEMPLGLSYQEIKAWAELEGREPNVIDVRALKKMSAVMREEHRIAVKEQRERAQAKN